MLFLPSCSLTMAEPAGDLPVLPVAAEPVPDVAEPVVEPVAPIEVISRFVVHIFLRSRVLVLLLSCRLVVSGPGVFLIACFFIFTAVLGLACFTCPRGIVLFRCLGVI